MPGTDSTRPRDTRIANDYIETVDAVIVTSLVKKPFSDADLGVMQILRGQKASIQNKLFFVLSQVDTLSDQELGQLEQTYRHALQNLNESFGLGNPDHFYLTSAMIGRLVRRRDAGEALTAGERDALEAFERQRSEFGDGIGPVQQGPLRELMAMYYKDGGIAPLRSALLEHFQVRSMQDKIRDSRQRLQAVYEALHAVVAPRFGNVREQRQLLRDRAIMRGVQTAQHCVSYVREQLKNDVVFEELSVQKCDETFKNEVTSKIGKAVEEVVVNFPYRYKLGGNPATAKNIARDVGEEIQRRYFELLDQFLKTGVFTPMQHRMGGVKIEQGGGQVEMGTLDETVERLFLQGSKPRLKYEQTKSEYHTTTQICLRARAAEEIRTFYNDLPDLDIPPNTELHQKQLDEFIEELKKRYSFKYNGLCDSLRTKARDYILYCLGLFVDQLLAILPVDHYIDEPGGVVDVDALLPGVSAVGVEHLERMNENLEASLAGLRDLDT